MKKVFALFAFLLIQITAWCSVIVYDDAKGLMDHHINDIYKAKNGLVWIATNNGLNYFDGNTFTELPELKGLIIHKIAFDPQRNVIWIASSRGLFSLELNTYRLNEATALIKDKDINCVTVYNQNVYSFFANGSVLKIGSQDDIIFKSHVWGKRGYIRREVAADNIGNVYVIPNDALYPVMFNLEKMSWQYIKSCKSGDIWKLKPAKTGCLIMLSDSGIIYHSASQQSEFLSNQLSGFAYQTKEGWLIQNRSTSELYYTNHQQHSFQPFNTELKEKLNAKVINIAFEDVNGMFWFGTNKGLLLYKPVSQFPFFCLLNKGIQSLSIRQIVENNKRELYIATYNGIYHYSPFTQAISKLPFKKPDVLFPLYTRCILPLSDTILLCGTESNTHYIYQYNFVKHNFEPGFTLKPKGANVSSVYAIFRSDDKQIWLGTDAGLASYDTDSKTVTLQQNNQFATNGYRIYYLSKAQTKNRFWVASREAIFLVDAKTGIVKKLDNNSHPNLPVDEFIFIDEDTKGNVWVGSKKSGLICIKKDLSTIKRYSKVDGLSNNEVYGLLWQNDSIAWVSTANGLNRFNIQSNVFNNYYFENGITESEFNQNSLIRWNDTLFYFGGINGITYFNPTKFAQQENNMYIYCSSVSKWSRPKQSFEQLQLGKPIQMNSDDHLLYFSLGLSDYSSTSSNTYFYRVLGLHDDWISLGIQSNLRFDALPLGKYTIEIVGVNRLGLRSLNTIKYDVLVTQVFYKTWWFFVLIALVVILFVFIYFKLYVRTIKQNQQLRTRIASNLHDEVGSLLTSIIISTDNARFISNDLQQKNDRLEKIAALSRMATNTMSDVLWSIDARNDSAGSLTDRMREHAEGMLFPLNIEVEFDFTQMQQNLNIAPNQRQELYLIFKEAIHNIAKHSKATFVKVIYKQWRGGFELSITNNHLEMASLLHRGQGIKNMEMRAKKINASFHIENAPLTFAVTIRSI